MNKFSSYFTLLVVAVATLFSSCGDDDDIRATVAISRQYLYFSGLNMQSVITYSGSDIAEFTYDEDDIPSGWDIQINRGAQTITVTGPTTVADFDSSLDPTTITFYAVSVDDQTTYDYLTVGTTYNAIDISDKQANSFMVSEPNTVYSFSALYKGEKQESIAPAYVDILWQTSPISITYTYLDGDNVMFHTSYDYDDDYDITADTDFTLVEGNAVIAAYNSSGTILWTWHIWVSDIDPDQDNVTFNGNVIMPRNLGARDNSTADSSTILESYGLYYQWGRKDPFVGPSSYNAAGSTDGYMLNEVGNSVYISYEESSSSVGKVSYTTKNPLTFVLGVEDSSYDWLYSAHSSDLWSETKTMSDPCPKGWRVASLETLSNLSIPTLSSDEHSAISDDYGWYINDAAGNKSLFMGLGRRGYITGKIQNVNLNESRPTPWAGFYWTADAVATTDNSSSALYFAYDSSDPANSTISTRSLYRSNGMQIRCQRDE